MLFRFTTLLLLVPLALGNPIPEADPEATAVLNPDIIPGPGPFPPRIPNIRFIGMNGQRKRTLSLNELIYIGGFDVERGCNGHSRQSNGKQNIEAFGGAFLNEVAGAVIARSKSTTERIFTGRGTVYNLDKVSGPDMGRSTCEASQAVVFNTGWWYPMSGGTNEIAAGDVSAGAAALIPPRLPLYNTKAFLYLKIKTDVMNIQRQYIQADMVTIYANTKDLMKDIEGYKKTIYKGQQQ